jgi:hypothetical protein
VFQKIFPGKVGWLQAIAPLVAVKGRWTATLWFTTTGRVLDPLLFRTVLAMVGIWHRCTTIYLGQRAISGQEQHF